MTKKKPPTSPAAIENPKEFDEIKGAPATDYEHHIFVSYRRSDEDWVRWTRENLVRVIASLLRPALGQINVYMDERIETGASWPDDLARNHARSRLLVAVLSRDYFQSDWCRLELALMFNREKTLGLRTQERPSGLIVPLVIDDGDQFPDEVKAIQSEKLHKFANPFIQLTSPKQEELSEVIKTGVCPAIEHMLKNIPQFDAGWEAVAHNQFRETFRIQAQKQLTVPSLSLGVGP